MMLAARVLRVLCGGFVFSDLGYTTILQFIYGYDALIGCLHWLHKRLWLIHAVGTPFNLMFQC